MKIKQSLIIFLLFSGGLFFISSCTKVSKKDLAGDWEVVKTEEDGVIITERFNDPVPQWFSLDGSGYYESGNLLRTHSGDWDFQGSSSKLSLKDGQEWWSESSWIVTKTDDYLLLKGVRMPTKKAILKPISLIKPEAWLDKDKTSRQVGRWRLLRSKKGFGVIGQTSNSDSQWLELLETRQFFAGTEEDWKVSGNWILQNGKITLSRDDNLSSSQWSIGFIANRMIFSTDVDDTEWSFIWERIPTLSGTEIKYIANEGILISRNGKKILIDAIHDYYGQDYLHTSEITYTNMISRSDPFDHVDYLLVSHVHGDHFDPAMTVDFLKNHPETDLLASQQTYDSIRLNQDYTLIESQLNRIPSDLKDSYQAKKNGISIEINYLQHVNKRHNWIQNLGHFIEIDGVRFLHVGDAELTASIPEMNYNERGIDVAILPYWFLWDEEGADLVKEFINPKVLIASHISPDNKYEEVEKVNAHWDGAVVFFREGDSWSKK